MGGSAPDHHQQQHDGGGEVDGGGQQQHGEHVETVMPGFRFHPTEEELIEFYLRRKVDGKRFNIDLIAFVDLYRYDPWDLPGTLLLPNEFHLIIIMASHRAYDFMHT